MYSHLDIYIIESQKNRTKKALRGHIVLFHALKQNQLSLWFCIDIFPLLLQISMTETPPAIYACNSLPYLYMFPQCLFWIFCVAFETHYFLSDTSWLWRTVYFLLCGCGYPIWFTSTPMSFDYISPIFLRKCHMKEQQICYKSETIWHTTPFLFDIL